MNERIKRLNEKIDAFAHETSSLNIETGKMGICLYFFMLADSLKNEQYQQWAEKLLDEIYARLQDISLNAVPELIQISIGIDFLLKQKCVEGNINRVLDDIDIVLFRRMTLSNNQQKLTHEIPEYLYILYYLYLRLEQQKPNTNNRFLMEELTIKAFNDVYASLNNDFYDEPILFNLDYKLPPFLFVLSKIHSLDFYNYRINEIIKEIAGLIQSRIPVLHANRLYLLWGLIHLKQATGFTFWDEQINLIYQSIDVSKIIKHELRNKQLFIKDGIAGIYLLLSFLEEIDCKISYDPEILRKRILNSDIWKESTQQPLAFISGMSGLLWVDYLINKKINAL